MNGKEFIETVTRELIENGEVEVKIHLDGSMTIGELQDKLLVLLQNFNLKDISIAKTKVKKQSWFFNKIAEIYKTAEEIEAENDTFSDTFSDAQHIQNTTNELDKELTKISRTFG